MSELPAHTNSFMLHPVLCAVLISLIKIPDIGDKHKFIFYLFIVLGLWDTAITVSNDRKQRLLSMEKIQKIFYLSNMKINLQLITAAVLSVGGLIMLFCGVFIDPEGEIHESLLVAFGEVATFSGALMGVDYVYRIKK